jgi:hypothetical protein
LATFSREDLIQSKGSQCVETIENCSQTWLVAITGSYTVIPWDTAPELLRDFCDYSGGDEDYILLTRSSPEDLPYWMERLSPYLELDTYCLSGMTIYVGTH